MPIRVRRVDLFQTSCRTRLPFRFGAVTMTRAPLLMARASVLVDDREASGFSSDLLVPRWFEKDPRKSAEQDTAALVASARRAGDEVALLGQRPSAFDAWWALERACVGERGRIAPDLLVRGFGVALVERALLDAVCRAQAVSFFEALRGDRLGFRPGVVHPELAGFDLPASLPDAPLRRVVVRHTVGLADPLRASDVPADARVEDGLPQALEEDVRHYGLTCFKVKLRGDRDADVRRLLDFARVVAESAPGGARFTLDGNEQYRDLSDLLGALREVERDPDGSRLLEGLLHIEQPLPRAESFDPERTASLPAPSELAPVIVDEADPDVDAWKRAMACGYRGLSVKNCKGVFRALLNRGLCAAAGDGFFQSSEDLTNLPVVALQQDLATVAALGLPHTERNGHHYFRGLAHLPEAEARDALRVHPDLYEETEAGISLRIAGGELALGSIQGPGYGYDVRMRTDERTRVG